MKNPFHSDPAIDLADPGDIGGTTPGDGSFVNVSVSKELGYVQQTATGDGTTTLDWTQGNKFFFTFGAQNETFTFTAPTNHGNLLVVLKQDSVGSRTITWPGTVKWPSGTAPTLSTGANAIDIVSFYYDGTSYYGVSNLNFT